MPADHTLTRDEARERAGLLSRPRYRVALDVTGEGPTFESRTELRFACGEPGTDSFVDLVADEVVRVTLNGVPVPAADITPGRIHLRGLAADNLLDVDARCSYERTGIGLHRFRDPVDGHVYLHTQFQPFDAHRVYACFDQPDIKGRFGFAVRAPSSWEVVSNREATRRDPDSGATLWEFAETALMPTYITAIVAGPYHHVHRRHGDVDLGVYSRQSLAPHIDLDEIFEVTAQGFDYYERVFDSRYPFGPKYDQLFVPEFNSGAMENPGCVTFSEAYVFRSKVTDAARQSRASTILHELAHMWFGNLVTMQWWDDLWLNESFATYMGHRALAEATRFRQSWVYFANSIKSWALDQDQLPTTHPIAADMPDTESVRTNFDGITYAKGASVLAQLAAWVGDEAFFGGLRDYFKRHAYGNATLTDFLTALEKRSGRALADWSAEWLETAGVATLRPLVEVDAGGRLASVAVSQEASDTHPTVRSHRLAVGCYELDGARLRRTRQVQLDVVGARTDVPQLAGTDRPDLLLVNDDSLTFAKLRLDERSVDTVAEHLSALEDPLARALVWGAAWDMTRDAELPTRRWVRLVAEHAAREDDLAVLQTLHLRARNAIDVYGDPGNRTAARAELAAAARAALQAAAPGSDRQLALVRHLVACGDGPDHEALLLGLLEGSEALEGLDVDTELRWWIVAQLASRGVADEERIAAELERDPTDIGVRHAAAARASRPSAGAKAHAWAALVDDRELPLATLREIGIGFWQPQQDDVLLPYVERFAEALESLWRDRVLEESIELTEVLFPRTIVDDRVVAMTDRVLATDLPGPARRMVEEARDRTRRALRARAVDAPG